VVCFIRGRTLYIWREVWEIGCEIDQLTALFDKIDPGWTSAKARDPSWRSLARSLPIIADNARPETISFLKRSGLPRIQPAIKGAGSIEEGIRFLQSYDIVVHPDCVHVKKELTHYSFIVDPHTGAVTSMLADKDNHTIDSLRYALENVRRARSVSARELRM
jgi:phage terminase large subunit